MAERTFTRTVSVEASAAEAFAWHSLPGALQRLTPPWRGLEVVSHQGGIEVGATARLRVALGPVRLTWDAVHTVCEPGRRFRDVQRNGPFALWEHTHELTDEGPDRCRLEDRIRWRLPLAAFSHPLLGGWMQRQLDRDFSYRHRVMANDLAARRRHRRRHPMKTLISGASGLVGSALVPYLTSNGHSVTRLVRRDSAGDGEIAWQPAAGGLDPAALAGHDAVVHLAGENISGRWSAAKKARIEDSRLSGTRLLAESLARMVEPPRVLVSASAIGYYGDRGEELLDEESAAGEGFLAGVCERWEAATAPAVEAGIRVVNLRIGVVLSPAGGALEQMLPPFRLGLGGRLGDGRQYFSWIAIDDLVGAIDFALGDDEMRGPVNAVAPSPVTNVEMTRTLGRVLRRPTVFPVPALAMRALFGEMADALLLGSARVAPGRLAAAGFEFAYPTLEAALRHVLGQDVRQPRVA